MEKINIFGGVFDDLLAGGCSSSLDGNMSLNCTRHKSALLSRSRFLRGVNINPESIICAKQKHSANIKLVGVKDCGRGAVQYDSAFENVDAFVTAVPEVPICVFTADCPAVFLFDKRKSVIGLVHAGWRGSKDLITAKTIALMKDKFEVDPQDLFAFLSPSIRSCCYEVNADFKDYFSEFLIKRKAKYYLDLIEVNRKQMMDCGLKPGNILDSNYCTFCNQDDFFSYRRDNASYARMMSVLMLKKRS